jgi:hypothetical protein
MNIAGWLLAVLIIELVAIVLVAFLSFSGFFDGMRVMAKIGIWLMTTGLMVQIMRSLYYFDVGSYPVDTIFPLWIAKDIGASLLVFDLFLLYFKNRGK